jgi:hypothetical protein
MNALAGAHDAAVQMIDSRQEGCLGQHPTTMQSK